MLQHTPDKPRYTNCQPKHQTTQEAHQLQTQTLLLEQPIPSWAHHCDSTKHHHLELACEKVGGRMHVGLRCRDLTGGLPNGWQQAERASTTMATYGLQTTDFRMADAHADAPSRAWPDEGAESAAGARAGTAPLERCDGDGERQLVWGSAGRGWRRKREDALYMMRLPF